MKSDILGFLQIWLQLGENKGHFTPRPGFVSLLISNATL
jgi:hypothetical protein